MNSARKDKINKNKKIPFNNVTYDEIYKTKNEYFNRSLYHNNSKSEIGYFIPKKNCKYFKRGYFIPKKNCKYFKRELSGNVLMKKIICEKNEGIFKQNLHKILMELELNKN